MTIVMTMVTKMSASAFKARCLELMDRVAATGESVIVTKRGVAVARLGPVVERPTTLVGFMAGEIELVGDVVEPVEETWDAESA